MNLMQSPNTGDRKNLYIKPMKRMFLFEKNGFDIWQEGFMYYAGKYPSEYDLSGFAKHRHNSLQLLLKVVENE